METATEPAEHWDQAYGHGDTTRSWFQFEPVWSLRMLDRVGFGTADSVIDVGGGSSPLVAALLARLLTFDDPSLRPYAPSTYSVTAKEQASPGGCRPWTLPVTPSDVTTGVRSVPAAAVETWAAGIYPTSACAGARRYQVLLHPLLPGEVP